MNRPWREESPKLSYNNWLRKEAVDSKTTLVKNTGRLLDQLRVLESVISQEGITTERFGRVSLAMVHLMIELHLLVTIPGRTD